MSPTTSWSRVLLGGVCEIFRICALAAASAATASGAEAQDGRELRVERVARPVTLDSFDRIPLARAEGFVQRDPSDGAPATQRTEVHVGYDDRRLYVVFRASDSEPRRIRARMTPRENIGGDDTVTVMIDTFHDRRRAYVFRTNPYGVQWDALWTEGRGFDDSFDTVWKSEGRLTETGYEVLFAIPFQSLRFAPTAEQRWGVIFSRSIPRDQAEDAYWPPVSARIQGRLNQAADLVGIENVSPSRNAQVIPYGTFRSFRALDVRGPSGPRFRTDLADGAAGLDAKTVIRDAVVVDATVNPDFSQVESDRPQVTVNQRFEVFFPERRPFFLENADVFRTPLNLVFTRRIADPRMGLRSTGKLGPWSFGTMLIDDEAPGKRVPDDDPLAGSRAGYAIARVNRDVGAQSTLGAIYVGREHATSRNRVGGVDGRLRFDDHWSTSFQAVASSTRPLAGADRETAVLEGRAFDLNVSRQGRKLNYFGSYTDLDRDFRADTGFVPRTDVRDTTHFLSYFFRPESNVIFWGPEFFVRQVWDQNGLRLDDLVEGSLEWHFPGQTGFEVNFRRARERLRPSDFPVLTENEVYDVGFWNVEYGTAFSDAFNVSGTATWGKQVHVEPLAGREPIGVDWRGSNLSVNLRPLTSLRIDNTYLYTRLALPGGGGDVLTDHIVRTRWNWQFSRELSLRVIAQYEATLANEALTRLPTRKNLNADVLLTYRIDPWTAIYAGYNGNLQNLDVAGEPGAARTQLVRTRRLRNDGSQVFVKLSYLLRF